jgi:hypothetical protein
MSVLVEGPRSAEPPTSAGMTGASALITSPEAARVAIGFAPSKVGSFASHPSGRSPFISDCHARPSSACAAL